MQNPWHRPHSVTKNLLEPVTFPSPLSRLSATRGYHDRILRTLRPTNRLARPAAQPKRSPLSSKIHSGEKGAKSEDPGNEEGEILEIQGENFRARRLRGWVKSRPMTELTPPRGSLTGPTVPGLIAGIAIPDQP